MRLGLLSLLLVVAAPGLSPARAADSPMQVCTAQWQQLGLSRAEYRPFLIKCLKGETPAPVKVSRPSSVPALPHKTKAPKTGHHPQATRMKACGAQWRQKKASGTTGGQTWRQFVSVCLKKTS